MDETISLSPLSTPLTVAWIGLFSLMLLLHRLLFFIASCARSFPTRSNRAVWPLIIVIPISLLLADTGQLAPALLAYRFAVLDWSEAGAFAGSEGGVASATAGVLPALPDVRE